MMKHRQIHGKLLRSWWRGRTSLALAVLLLLIFSGTALAAEVMGGDTYILPRGEVVSDDLYATGGEVIIDGTVEGDLVVAGGYVEVNGVVMGDLIAAGGAVVINGVVQDDVRAAGGGVILSGSVGDDFFAAAGGGWPAMVPIPMGTVTVEGRSVPQGLQINAEARIGGDAYVAGGQGTIAGSIGRDLGAGMGTLIFGGRVARNADLSAQSLTVQESAQVQGELRYSTASASVVPEGVAASVVARPMDNAASETPTRNPVGGFFRWLLRTALVLAGYLLAGWLLWSFAPRQITEPLAVMERRPMEATITGLLVAVAALPVGAALVFLAILFWGWFPGGLTMASFVFGLITLVWLLSPLISGMWVGRRLGELTGVPDGPLARLLVGIAAIVLIGRILTVVPCVGDLTFLVLYLASFAVSVGSWLLARRRPPQDDVLLPAPVVPAA
jgi:hypothetical protein